MKRLSYCVVLGLSCFVLSSCSVFDKKADTAVETARSEQAESYLVHTVGTSGETLGLIAEWYTGAVKRWKIIAKHNPSINVRAIKVGQKIKIPRSIVKQETPLSPEAVTKRLSSGSYKEPDVEAELSTVNLDTIDDEIEEEHLEEPNIEDAIIDVNVSAYERPPVRDEPQRVAPEIDTVSEKPSLPFRTYEKKANAKDDSLRFDEVTSKALRKQAPAAESNDPEDVKKLLKSREEYLQQLLEE